MLKNDEYRCKIIKKLGQSSLSPTFQGEGLQNVKDFYIPLIESPKLKKQLKKLNKEQDKFYNQFSSKKQLDEDSGSSYSQMSIQGTPFIAYIPPEVKKEKPQTEEKKKG